MALHASHIRFALDTQRYYSISNLESYLTGSIYPDSRYKTGLNRELTHPVDFLGWNPERLDNFRSGQHSHLLCDKVQSSLISQKLMRIVNMNEIKPGNDEWQTLTAIKIIQDMDDLTKFDVKSNLPKLDLIEPLNGEDMSTLQYYYQSIIETYSKETAVNFDDYLIQIIKLGLEPMLAGKIIDKAKDFISDDNINRQVTELYDEMLIETEKLMHSYE